MSIIIYSLKALFNLLTEGFMKIDSIRRLSLDELKALHRECIRRDFPKNEVRPYSMVKRLASNNLYIAYGAYCNNTLIAYATFFNLPDSPVTLLDYLAVQPEHRGTGIGSSFIGEFKSIVKNEFPHSRVIAIECESPQYATSTADKATREKRINFYIRNGAVITQSTLYAFGVNYNLLAVYLDNSRQTLKLGEGVYNLYLYGFKNLLKGFAKKHLKYFDAQ